MDWFFSTETPGSDERIYVRADRIGVIIPENGGCTLYVDGVAGKLHVNNVNASTMVEAVERILSDQARHTSGTGGQVFIKR